MTVVVTVYLVVAVGVFLYKEDDDNEIEALLYAIPWPLILLIRIIQVLVNAWGDMK